MPIAGRASLAYSEELAHDGLVFRNRGIPSTLASHHHVTDNLRTNEIAVIPLKTPHCALKFGGS
jgi:hypothetical protein